MITPILFILSAFLFAAAICVVSYPSIRGDTVLDWLIQLAVAAFY